MDKINWLFSKPFVRIFVFILFSYIFFEISYFVFSFELIYHRINLLLSVLIPSIAIEYFRAGSKPFAFGLNIDKLTVPNFVAGLLIAFIAVFIIFLSKLFLISHIVMNPNAFSIILELAFDSLIVALTEELLFRGIIFQAFLDKFKPISTIIFTSLLFSSVHYLNPGFSTIAFINVFFAGIIFGTMFYVTKNLWMPIAFHFFWNFLTAGFIDTPVSGIIQELPIRYELSFPQNTFGLFISNLSEMIYGNNFGIESGLITTLVLIISIILTVKYARLSPFQSAIIFKRSYEESKLMGNGM